MDSPTPHTPESLHPTSLPLLATAADDEIALWESAADDPLEVFAPHADAVTSLKWTTNDRVLASGSRDGTIALSNASGEVFDTLDAATSGAVEVLCITWSPGSRYLAAGGSDAVVRIFDMQKRAQALVLRGHRAAVRGVAWSPSEVYVASTSDAGGLIIHRVQGSVAAVAKLTQPQTDEQSAPSALGALQWAPFQPALLATAAADGAVSVWEFSPSDPKAEPNVVFDDHADTCTGVMWSPVNQVRTRTRALPLPLLPPLQTPTHPLTTHHNHPPTHSPTPPRPAPVPPAAPPGVGFRRRHRSLLRRDKGGLRSNPQCWAAPHLPLLRLERRAPGVRRRGRPHESIRPPLLRSRAGLVGAGPSRLRST